MKIVKKIIMLLIILITIGFTGLYLYIYIGLTDSLSKYIDIIEKYSKEYNVDKELIVSIIKTESSFVEDVESHVGAQGLMQIMPETGKWIASKLDEKYSKETIFNPDTNIKYGTYLIKTLIDNYDNVDLAIMAYNAGIGNVDGWIEKGIIKVNNIDYRKIPFSETRNYVSKVKKEYNIIKKTYYINYKEKNTSNIIKAFEILKVYIFNMFN